MVIQSKIRINNGNDYIEWKEVETLLFFVLILTVNIRSGKLLLALMISECQ